MKRIFRSAAKLNAPVIAVAIVVAYLAGLRGLDDFAGVFAIVGAVFLLFAAGASTAFPTSIGGKDRMMRVHDEMALNPDLGLDDSHFQVTQARIFFVTALLTFAESGLVAFAGSLL